MRNTVLYIAMSLDGYIARENGEIDWLEEAEGKGDNGYGEFLETIDTVIMGRKTYEQVLGFDIEFPYQDKECYVFSNKREGMDEYASFQKGNPSDLLLQLKQKSGKDIWLIGGGDLIKHFMQEQLVDKFIIAVIPVLLGKGISLFDKGFPEQKLSLSKSERFNEIVLLTYELKKL
ncbi:dihydrofolate reductase [Bacillus sp. FJAT-42376]|uniref:dihydrofolate reductase family protein n=1 Tax=Bacillus sp. FJAT-42376 TaxID=2014076 RepID=UPI000F4D4C72|nr:dihydrofolate reductase family protein [Bacillus sp. FJAT-42376]AZB44370.1 dihydrofolate reductase [Bacillus sp. FJAT-42376]